MTTPGAVFHNLVLAFQNKDNDGVDGFNVLQDMIFRLRQDPETRLWRVREWEDEWEVITN